MVADDRHITFAAPKTVKIRIYLQLQDTSSSSCPKNETPNTQYTLILPFLQLKNECQNQNGQKFKVQNLNFDCHDITSQIMKSFNIKLTK